MSEVYFHVGAGQGHIARSIGIVIFNIARTRYKCIRGAAMSIIQRDVTAVVFPTFGLQFFVQILACLCIAQQKKENYARVVCMVVGRMCVCVCVCVCVCARAWMDGWVCVWMGGYVCGWVSMWVDGRVGE